MSFSMLNALARVLVPVCTWGIALLSRCAAAGPDLVTPQAPMAKEWQQADSEGIKTTSDDHSE